MLSLRGRHLSSKLHLLCCINNALLSNGRKTILNSLFAVIVLVLLKNVDMMSLQ